MPRPTLIELTIPDDQSIYLTFEDKPVPYLNSEIYDDEIHASVCPDDGTPFLKGSPKHYVYETIRLDPPDGSLALKLTKEMFRLIKDTFCSAGGALRDGEGGKGLGLHDAQLSIFCEDNAGIAIVIDRPGGRKVRRYYDEDNSLGTAADAREVPGSADRGEATEVEMGGQDDGRDGATIAAADDLAKGMRTLRLKSG